MEQKEKKLQEKYMEMQAIESRIKEMQKQAQMVEEQLIELMSTLQGLDDFEKVNKGDEILVPVSSGIFAKAELKDKESFLVNVGAGTVVAKDFASTKKLIEKQVESIRSLHVKASMNIQQSLLHASEVEKELKDMASKVQ
ncbi:prefoldin subunit alpha [Candidatus Woesearchaeota archaeon]|nr:prefoldin subunit alpha [Candidatus Woesearchaeota archaeon]